VHRQTRRLVEDDQPGIAVQDALDERGVVQRRRDLAIVTRPRPGAAARTGTGAGDGQFSLGSKVRLAEFMQ
jgi:hypothetical protein